MDEIFESLVRSAGDLAGVFESDGEVSYFYLYRVDAASGSKILDAIRVSTGEPDFEPNDVKVQWTADEQLVFLTIKDRPCAVFDCERSEKHGGDWKAAEALIPESIVARLSRH